MFGNQYCVRTKPLTVFSSSRCYNKMQNNPFFLVCMLCESLSSSQ
jgi:hypothetical protein